MKKLLSILLLIGACSVTPEPEKEPSIGPQLKLMDLNPTEEKIMGTWIRSDGAITEHRYHETLGKKTLSYDKNGVFISCYSFEIKEDFYADNQHLVVDYLFDLPWNEALAYVTYNIVSDTSFEYIILVYDLLDPQTDTKDPMTLKYLCSNPDGSPVRLPMKKIDVLDAQQEPNDIEELFVERLKNEEN